MSGTKWNEAVQFFQAWLVDGFQLLGESKTDEETRSTRRYTML